MEFRQVRNNAGQKATIAYNKKARKGIKCRRVTRWDLGKPGKALKNPTRKIANGRLKSAEKRSLDDESQEKKKKLCSKFDKKK
jgi:hypothetical protein